MTPTRLLLVEDDERNAELIRFTLEPAGFVLARVRTLADARRRISHGLPDAILLDMRLPDGPGHALASEVRAAPGGDGVHIIAVSASVRPVDRELALKSGCDEFMEKPISPRDLVVRLRRRIEGRR
jgi:two-component system, cell cycle response regulator DivK